MTPIKVKSPWLHGWYVDPPGWNDRNRGDAEWRTRGGRAFRFKHYPNREATRLTALTYADRKARTVPVTLPPVGQVTKVHGTTIITTTTGQVIHGYPRAGHRLQEVFVPHERAEEFALALLAHVRKGTHEPRA